METAIHDIEFFPYGLNRFWRAIRIHDNQFSLLEYKRSLMVMHGRAKHFKDIEALAS
jgi:hypothetical protein